MSLVSERAGTLLYMAPEQLTKRNHSKKVDMWACGVLMYQLMCQGKHPYHEPGKESEIEFRYKMERLEQEPLNVKLPKSRFSPLAIDFFNKLCVYPQTARYDASTALQHPWITRNENQKIPLTLT